MHYLYILSTLSLDQLALHIANTSLFGFAHEKRDGLNLGGGEYFKFSKDGKEILLVCNDIEHQEVFVESMANFPHYCYARRGAESELEQLLQSLSKSGLVCEIANEA